MLLLSLRKCKFLIVTCTNLSQDTVKAECVMQHCRYFKSVWSGTNSKSVTGKGERFVSGTEIHSYFIIILVHFAIQGRDCYVGAKCAKRHIDCTVTAMKNVHLSWAFIWFKIATALRFWIFNTQWHSCIWIILLLSIHENTLGAMDENPRGKTTDKVMIKLIFSIAGMPLCHWHLCRKMQTQN